MVRVADYVFKLLAERGIRHAFLVVGGGAMFLNDGLRRETRIRPVCCHHEQACAIAAEGYFRAGGRLAVINITTGPGGLNTLTGVMGQWTDSIPALYLSGQVKYVTTVQADLSNDLRQLGDQEVDIIRVVRPLTKYAKMITDPLTIRYELEKALHIATTGRMGPVWLDLPMNVQGAMVEEEELASYKPEEDGQCNVIPRLDELLAGLEAAQRPLIVAGHGIRLSGCKDVFRTIVEELRIPVVTTFNGFDLLPNDSEVFAGRIGTLGSRAGNFALQNADFVLCLGTRNNLRQVSYDWSQFARNATLAVVDIDPCEIRKTTVRGHLPIHADVKRVVASLGLFLKADPRHLPWLRRCQAWRERYPLVLDCHLMEKPDGVNPYVFASRLTSILNHDATVVAGNGTACISLFQAGVVKQGQRMFWNSGCASMGYDLPAAVGAAVATERPVICVTGDGSIQMNLQELQTIRHHGLPIGIFVLNNGGYRSIVQTQDNYFEGRIGCDLGSGLSFPDLENLASLYGLAYYCIDNGMGLDYLKNLILFLGRFSRGFLCEVVLTKDYIFAPKLSSTKRADGTLVSHPLEDLHPCLDPDELAENMNREVL